MFIIGTLFGSFFSLAIYRIPRKQDIVYTRSYCPNCKHRLEFFDLIPILSYIFHFGKCKYCKDKISIRYFLLELCNGVLFVILYLIFGYTFNLLFVALAYAIIFVLLGSYIMKSKMTEAEIESVEKSNVKEVQGNKEKNKLKNKKNIKSAKKGVFLVELFVAIILFSLFVMSSYVMMRNYSGKKVKTIARSNAVAIAVRNIEIALAIDYDKLNSFESSEEISGINYTVDTSVYKYSDEDFEKEDLVKKIEVKVEYILNGNPYEFSLNTLKGKGR
jgi:prepilin signal peptidase PulO-like enzyme (type II secretory pathway)